MPPEGWYPPPPQQPPYPQQQPYPQQLYPQQQPYPPYPPPGAYPPPPAPATNWWAVVSLIFGIIGGILISVICGFVGLSRARDGRGGRGMAIAGLVLSGLWALGLVVFAAFAVVASMKGTVNADTVAEGDCLKELPATGLVMTVDKVSCAEPHKGEIFAVITMPDGDFPGTSAIEDYQDRCAPTLDQNWPEASRDPDIGLFVLYPTEDSWGQGDRAVTCIATSLTARTGSLQK